MYRLISSLLLLGYGATCYAYSIIQTDWSGGPGYTSPVDSLGTNFYCDTHTEWYLNPGELSLSFNPEYVSNKIEHPWFVSPSDINGDGYYDIVTCTGSYPYQQIVWRENSDTTPGVFWTEHLVYEGYSSSTRSGDIDSDGDLDLLVYLNNQDDLTWQENLDGAGTSWALHYIDYTVFSAEHVFPVDMDGDNDLDAVVGAGTEVIWFENMDGVGGQWTEHPTKLGLSSVSTFYPDDVDNDGDIDLIISQPADYKLSWLENMDGSGENWTQNVIQVGFKCIDIYPSDLDGDGDSDVVGGSHSSTEGGVAWWENADGSGSTWISHVISTEFLEVWNVMAGDLDNDGDNDVVSSKYQGIITWWENTDSSATEWEEHILCDLTSQPIASMRSIGIADFNSNGINDVAACMFALHKIGWWAPDQYPDEGMLESSIIDTQYDPDWEYINWSAETPPGTSLGIQVRSSDDWRQMGDWSEILYSPCSLDTLLSNDHKYMQYKVIMETVSPSETPVLHDIEVFLTLGITEEGSTEHNGFHVLIPNPSSEYVQVYFSLPETSHVEILVFDIYGRLLGETILSEPSPGENISTLGIFPPGVYFCRISGEGFASIQKFVVLS